MDAVRTASWVRRHDVVIVPGAGALEATLPTRPWGFPYTLFLLTTSGKLFGTKVALVSVGANAINKRAGRWLSNTTARLAFYRSYRDAYSQDAMRQRGLDASGDHVYPDLVFGIPTPPYDPGDPKTVGVGVMAYYGGNDDRRHAAEIHVSYMEKMTRFTQWLVDSGYRVRLFGGDGGFDDGVAQQILKKVRQPRPGLEPGWVTIEPFSSMTELMQVMAPVGTVVATRYQNVICALKLCKPTISLGYSEKFASLVADMGLAEYSQFVYSLDVEKLIEQFTKLESNADSGADDARRSATRSKARLLAGQFAAMDALLFPAGEPGRWKTTGYS